MEEDLNLLAPLLLAWYREHRRILPWRSVRNPYYTLVSEIMLQQTRVETVIPYFQRFITAYPDIASLACAGEEDLLKLWEGLGYYSRARNLRTCAAQVMDLYGGKLPEDPGTLVQLKGIGEYTAGAIASIAYGKPVPAVDGNVLRIFTRLTRDGDDITAMTMRRHVSSDLSKLIPTDSPGDFNQALMDLGAMICLPGNSPLCGHCPLSGICLAYRAGDPGRFPVRSAKKPRRVEEHTILLILNGPFLLLQRRPEKGLLAGMYEPVNLIGRIDSRQALEYTEALSLSPLSVKALPEARHIFTHVEWRMSGHMIRTSPADAYALPEGLVFASRDELSGRYPVPSAFRPFIRYFV